MTTIKWKSTPGLSNPNCSYRGIEALACQIRPRYTFQAHSFSPYFCRRNPVRHPSSTSRSDFFPCCFFFFFLIHHRHHTFYCNRSADAGQKRHHAQFVWMVCDSLGKPRRTSLRIDPSKRPREICSLSAICSCRASVEAKKRRSVAKSTTGLKSDSNCWKVHRVRVKSSDPISLISGSFNC